MDRTDVLIIGGGISGITSALELAETGLKVVLVEKSPYLGGRVSRMNQYFPKLCPPYCGLEINFQRIRRNPNISILNNTIVETITGEKGSYTVGLTGKAEFINDNCTCCGECENVCPVTGPDDFNYGMKERKAITIPHEMAYPFKYNLDESTCLFEDCKKCVEVCEYQAIDLAATSQKSVLITSAIINATGWQPYDVNKLAEYRYDQSEDIITNVMMERLSAPNGPTGGKIVRLSDQLPVRKLAFIQCAGSRDTNHLPYCSAVCCSASLKQALYATEQDPDVQVSIFYIDLRVSGRNEDFLKKVEQHDRISLIKGKVAELALKKSSGKIIVRAEDIMQGRIRLEEFDMLVLATGIMPEQGVKPYAIEGSGSADQLTSGYMKERSDDMITAGCAGSPMDVSSSLKDATNAALKAFQIYRKKQKQPSENDAD